MDDKIEELLVKKLDEGLSDSEERELNVWLGESWEHAVIFKEMREVRLWMDTGKSYNPDVKSGFKKIRWRYRPYRDWETDRKSTRLNSSHITRSRMPSSA